ncbi:hypothetical protein HZS_5714, partial [Henneguya salminicola]
MNKNDFIILLKVLNCALIIISILCQEGQKCKIYEKNLENGENNFLSALGPVNDSKTSRNLYLTGCTFYAFICKIYIFITIFDILICFFTLNNHPRKLHINLMYTLFILSVLFGVIGLYKYSKTLTCLTKNESTRLNLLFLT